MLRRRSSRSCRSPLPRPDQGTSQAPSSPGGDLRPLPPPDCPGSILCAKEMSASEIESNEASKDTNVKKIGQSGLKIRIRLPARKTSDDTLMRSTGVSEDSENLIAKNPEQTDNNTPSTICTTAEMKAEEANDNPPVLEGIKNLPAKEIPKQTDNNTRRTLSKASKPMVEEVNKDHKVEGLCNETSSNNESETSSRDSPPEKVDVIAPSKNPVADTGVKGEEEISYHVGMRLCEDRNENILDKELPAQNSFSTPNNELFAVTLKTPSKNTTGMGAEVETNSGAGPCEDASNNVLSNRLLCETNINTSNEGISKEATINCPSKNLTTSALKCEEANDKPVVPIQSEAKNYMATEKLLAEARNNVPRKRPAVPANDKTSKKRLRSSVVHATETCKKTSGMKPSSAVQAVEQSKSTTNLNAVKVYKEFEEKVRRTVYLDNLSHLASEIVIKVALNQFGTVRNVSFLTNYTVPYDIPQSALVEMETEKDAESVVSMLHEFPFMMSGMPRPVRGRRATAVMFNDRPRKPGGKLEFCWVGPTDPNYQNVRKFKFMSKRHEVENLALIRLELEGEEMLAKQQQDDLNCNYKKLETVDTVIMAGWAGRLSRIYNMRFNEAF